MSKFTKEQVAAVVAVYSEAVEQGKDYDERAKVIKAQADLLDTTVPSIRGVLVSEGVYVGKPKAAKGEAGMDKSALVGAFEAVTGKTLKSMGNMTKKDLETLWQWVVSTSDQKQADA